MNQHTIDQVGSPDQVARPDKRAEILASHYRRALAWAQGHGADVVLAGTFAGQYAACVAGACTRYPDAGAPTPAEFADDHALAFGRLTDTTPSGPSSRSEISGSPDATNATGTPPPPTSPTTPPPPTLPAATTPTSTSPANRCPWTSSRRLRPNR